MFGRFHFNSECRGERAKEYFYSKFGSDLCVRNIQISSFPTIIATFTLLQVENFIRESEIIRKLNGILERQRAATVEMGPRSGSKSEV